MKKVYVILSFLLLVNSSVYADENHKNVTDVSDVQQNENKNYTKNVTVNVTGLVCDFCARALEKVFSKEKAVQNIDVNLDDGFVSVNFKDNQFMAHNKLVELIVNSGYNVESIEEVKK